MEMLYGNKDQDYGDDVDLKVLSPYMYIQRIPRKHLSVKLTTAFNHWLKISEDKLEAVGEVLQTLHGPYVMIDDIQDNSTLRGGVPSAHLIFGVPLTLNASIHAIAITMKRTLALGHPLGVTILMEELLNLCRGQGLEIYWRDNYQCPTEEEFKEMVIGKLSSMFMLAMRLMQLFSKNQTDYRSLIVKLAFYFQVKDDFLTLWSQYDTTKKSFCDDIQEGKYTFPIIHAIKNERGGEVFLNMTTLQKVSEILRQRTHDIEILRYCVSLLEHLGSFQYTRDVLKRLDREVRDEMAQLGGNPHLETMLDEMFDQIENTKPMGLKINT